jgi:hypothetical protein
MKMTRMSGPGGPTGRPGLRQEGETVGEREGGPGRWESGRKGPERRERKPERGSLREERERAAAR